jgi:hypothetical protein
MKHWSELNLVEKVAAVREMAAMKFTLSQMAAELGTTRGVISGIRHRDGVAQKRKATMMKTVDGPSTAVPFLATRPHHCRWLLAAEIGVPVMVCGAHAPDPGHPWCEQHMKRVFTPARR